MTTKKEIVVASKEEVAKQESQQQWALEGRGWIKHKLIRDLALGVGTQKELAVLYQVSENSITKFKQRHHFEIDEVRNNLADEYAGAWIAQKLTRLQLLQDAAEKMASGRDPRSAEVLVNILKAAAEELGQLPARTQVQVNQQSVTYQVVGINPDDLR